MASGLTYLKPAPVLRCILLIAFSLSVEVLARQDHGRIYEQEQILEPLTAEGFNVLPIDKLPLARPIQSRSSHSDRAAYLVVVPSEEQSAHALEPQSSQLWYSNAYEQDYWSARSMGRRSLDELGFPVVTSTSDNYHYNFNWAQLGHAQRHKRASPTQKMTKVAGVIDTLDDLLVGESRRTERRGVEPEPKRDYKGQTQEYDGPYIYTQLFGPPYEIGYIRSPIPSKHVYDDYLQFVRSWSSGARDAVDSGAYKVDNYRGDVSSKDADYKSNKDADYSPKPAYSEPKKESYDNKPYSAPTESYSAPEKDSYDTKDAGYGKGSSSSYEVPKAAYTDNKKDDDYVAKGADRESNYDEKKTYTEPNKKGDNYRESSYEAKQPSRDTAYDSKPASVEYRETNKGYDNPPAYSAPKAAASYSDDGYKSNRDNYDTPSYSTSDKGSSHATSKSYEAPPTYMMQNAPAHNDDGYSRGKESMPMYEAKPKGDTYSSKGSSYPEESYSTTPYSAMKAVYSTPFYPVKESYKAPAAIPAKYDNPPKSAATYEDSYDSKSHSSGYEESSKGYQAPATYSTKAAPYSNDGQRGDKDSYDTSTYSSSSSKGGSSYTETKSYEAPRTKANYDSKPAAYSDDGYGRGKDTSYEAPPSKASYVEDTKPYKAPMAAYDEEYSAPKASSHDEGYKTTVAKDYKAPTTYEDKEYSVPKAGSSYDDGYKTSVAKDYKAPATYDEKEYSAPKATSSYDDGYRNTNTKDYKAPSAYEDNKEYVAPKASINYDDGYKGSNTKDYKAPAAPSAYPDKEYSAPKASGSYDDGYKVSSGPASYSDDYSASSQTGSGGSSYNGNKDDYDSVSYKASGKDYATTEAYPSESTTRKHHYPVIIGRYQVTDSKAFLPVSVNGDKGGNSGSSDGNYVEGGTYTAKGPNDEYVVYYLPYGQPLPVKLRKRSAEPYSSSFNTPPINGSVNNTAPETRSVATLARLHSFDHLRLPLRSPNNSSFSPEDFLSPLTNTSQITQTEVPVSSITDPTLDFVTTRLDMDLSELISHLEFEAQSVAPVTFKNDSHLSKIPVGNFGASDEAKSQLFLFSTTTSTQEPDLVRVLNSSTVVSHKNFHTKLIIPNTYSTTKTPAEPQALTSSNNAFSTSNGYVKDNTFQSSRILPGLTQRPVRYIDSSSGLISKDIAHWNGYTTWWTKLGNKIANVHNYE